MNQQKRNNSKFFYLLAGMLLLVGTIGVVSAKQTASIYDAPDLHLVQGSEQYDLKEGITYDSSKYELAVKDTVDFDINQIGEYQVSYILTPKEKTTASKEESGEKAQSTEEATVAEQSDEEASVETDADSKEETILFKRAVFADADWAERFLYKSGKCLEKCKI